MDIANQFGILLLIEPAVLDAMLSDSIYVVIVWSLKLPGKIVVRWFK